MLQFPKTVLKPPKEWKRQITTIKESYSFSSLMSQKQTTPEKSSLEETQKLIPRKTINNETEFEALNEKEKISHLPSGIKIGNLVHQVLDSWQSPYQTQNNLIRNEQTKNFIRQQLPFFKIEKFWADTLFTLCQKSYQHLLQIDAFKTSLLEIAPQNRAGEIKFYLDLKKPELIEKIVFLTKKNPQCKVLQSLQEIVLQFTDKEFQNICVGIIDLIFLYQKKYYILDWKTNWLGERVEDYHSENLFGAMLHHNYFLQYFLYYLALEKFLIAKNSSFRIGGVFYLFVRGSSAIKLSFIVYSFSGNEFLSFF